MFEMSKPTKEDYDKYAKFSAKFHLDELKNEEIGKLVLCECRNENETRLYIHRFDQIDDLFKRDGWWDTFTLSIIPCKNKGYYLCEIKDFRLDRNGFLNMIVNPKHYLGEKIDIESDAWIYFFISRLFTDRYRPCKHIYYKTRFNVEALYKRFEEDVDRIVNAEKEKLGDDFISADRKIAAFIMDLFISGKITLEQIEAVLDEKSNIEKLADDLNYNIKRYGLNPKNKYVAEFPLLVKKLPVEEYGVFKGYYTTESTIRYLERKSEEYRKLNLGNETDILKCGEAVLQYWAEIKLKGKEEKKRKKKEEKQKKDS